MIRVSLPRDGRLDGCLVGRSARCMFWLSERGRLMALAMALATACVCESEGEETERGNGPRKGRDMMLTSQGKKVVRIYREGRQHHAS